MKNFLLVFIVALLLLPASAAANDTLVRFGQNLPTAPAWRYKGGGTNLDAVLWKAIGYAEPGWLTGNSALGFGTNPPVRNTAIPEDASAGGGGVPGSRYPTLYFRKVVNIPNPALYIDFEIRAQFDDGIVVWVNGVEAFRNNINANPVYNDLAPGAIGGNGATVFTGTVNTALFVPGNNIIAVEVHQNALTSSDLFFDMELIGRTSIPPSPFVLRPFTQRYHNNSVKGNIVYLANSIVSTTGIGAGSPGTGEAPPGGTTTNGGAGIHIDVDGIAATFNSSTSDLTLGILPSCSQVLFAGLYWGAGEGSGAGNTSWITGNTSCKLKIPGASSYTTVTAAQTDYWNSTLVPGYVHTGYQCFANITSLINSTSANGTYAVADVVSPLGLTDAYGGWTIVIAYSNPSLAPRNLSVFDGTAIVKSGSGNVDVPINGFLTPPTGPVSCELGAVVFDGDRVSSDAFAFMQNGGSSFFDLTPTATNPTSNLADMWNSVIAYKGNVVTTRNPAFQNTLGYDANIINLPNAGNARLSNSQTGATVRFSSPSENYIVQVLSTSISQYTPIFSFDKTATDISGATLTPGDSLRYQVNYNNVGNDASTNTMIIDNIPSGTTYLPGSLRINGVVKTDASGDDEADYDLVNNRVIFRLGSGATSSAGGTINNGGNGNVSFNVLVASSCNVLSCATGIRNSARIAYTGLTSGVSEFDSSGVNSAGCIIKGPVVSSAVGSCFTPGDTLIINNCPVTSAFIPWRRYAGYTIYSAKPFITANIYDPLVAVTATHTYWAYYSNGSGCSDTIRISMVINNCPDIDDDNDGLPDYVEFNNPVALQDHNSNGIPNWKDALYPGYVDNNTDGVNDNFDWGADADNDGIPNFYDNSFAGFVDTNGDGVNDNSDKDGDGIPNQYDLDSDNDGLPDVVEAYGVDAHTDGKIDNYTDTDNDGLSQNVDANNTGVNGSGNGLGVQDFDGDGIANYLDLDSDNDGIPDIIEAGGADANNNALADANTDLDSDGFADGLDGDVGNDGTAENSGGALLVSGIDADNNGRADNWPYKNLDNDARPNAYDMDSDGDGITDVIEAGFTDAIAPFGVVDGVIGVSGWSNSVSGLVALNLRNTDANGNPDYLDIDSDNDGIPDNIEGMSTAGYIRPVSLTDTDGDGLINHYDNVPAAFSGTGIQVYDHDGDGIPDYRDLDTDADGQPDIIEGNDFNLNGFMDDLVTLTGLDTDGDGLDNRFDSLNSVTNIKGTSYRMGTGGTFTGDPTPGSRTTVQRTQPSQPDRDWRSAGVVLPVQFLNFSGIVQGRQVPLQWTIITAKAIDRFEIERSTDNTNYSNTGIITTAVKLNEQQSFAYTDDIISLNTDVIYYRLKVTGKAEEVKYSNILVIRIKQIAATPVTIIPNPATDYIAIKFIAEKESEVTIKLVDNSGKTVLLQKQKVSKGSNVVGLHNLGQYSTGVYTAQVFVNNEIVTQKLIINH